MPLVQPRREMRRNPFTGQEAAVTIWDPGPSGACGTLYAARGRLALPPVMPPEDDYQLQLEEAAPALLRTFPHAALKGISEVELRQLGAALAGDALPPARFVDCDEDEGSIGAIQAAAISILAEASDPKLHEYAAIWRARLIEVEPAGLEWALQRIRALARDAVARSGSLFSHAAC